MQPNSSPATLGPARGLPALPGPCPLLTVFLLPVVCPPASLRSTLFSPMDTRRVFKSLDLITLSTPPSPSMAARGPPCNVLIPYGMGGPGRAAPAATPSSSSTASPRHLVALLVEGSLTPWSVKPTMAGVLPRASVCGPMGEDLWRS